MDHLLQLSTVACQAERLDESLSRTPSPQPPSSSSSSSSSSSRQNSSDGNPPPFAMELAPSSSSRDKIQSTTKSTAETIMANDRKIIRDKIKIAYKKKANSFDELLDLCSSYAESQVFENAPTKLDYYKNGISCCKTIFELSDQINIPTTSEKVGSGADTPAAGDDVPRGLKRAKTQH